jgi:hypothetical protein
MFSAPKKFEVGKIQNRYRDGGLALRINWSAQTLHPRLTSDHTVSFSAPTLSFFSIHQ